MPADQRWELGTVPVQQDGSWSLTYNYGFTVAGNRRIEAIGLDKDGKEVVDVDGKEVASSLIAIAVVRSPSL